MLSLWRNQIAVNLSTLGSVLMVTTATAAFANTTFDTTPAWNGASYIQPFGNPDTSTYGQTFVAGADSLMTDFIFYLNAPQRIIVQFTGDVYAWTGSLLGGGGRGATGASLFTNSSTVLNGDNSFQAVRMEPNVCLKPGAQYVAFLTVSNPTDFDATTGTSVWGNLRLSHVANNGGGGFVFYNNGNNPSLLNASAWDNFSDFGDLAWKADFSRCPEPGAIATAIVMFGGLGLGMLKRRRKQ